MQLFGSKDVHALFLIGTPNNGITPEIKGYCALFGSAECDDMVQDSLFIRKLGPSAPNIPVYNFIGSGCKMDGGDGDGIVLAKNAYLEGANNIQINGSCKGLERLHTTLIRADKVPDVFNYITKILKEN